MDRVGRGTWSGCGNVGVVRRRKSPTVFAGRQPRMILLLVLVAAVVPGIDCFPVPWIAGCPRYS